MNRLFASAIRRTDGLSLRSETSLNEAIRSGTVQDVKRALANPRTKEQPNTLELALASPMRRVALAVYKQYGTIEKIKLLRTVQNADTVDWLRTLD